MSDSSNPGGLADVSDEELVRLAAEWRAQAGRGHREAFGIAHALEVEQRRRQRDRQLQPLREAPPPAAARPWWQRWRSRRSNGGSAP